MMIDLEPEQQRVVLLIGIATSIVFKDWMWFERSGAFVTAKANKRNFSNG